MRDLVTRYGGHAEQHAPQNPVPDCTVLDCAILVSIRTARSYLDGRVADVIDTALAYSGIPPWEVVGAFEVKDGKLRTVSLQIATARVDYKQGPNGLVGIGYMADARRKSYTDPIQEQDYEVSRPHVTGPPADVLESSAVIFPGAPVLRTFVVDLACLTRILVGCKGPEELAPSARADYPRR